MNQNAPRISNPVLCYLCIGLGVLCMFVTVLAAFLLKDGIIGRVGKPPRVDAISDGFKIESFNQRIESVERDIELEKKNPFGDLESERRKIDEALKRANANYASNKTPSLSANKAEKIKGLEEKKRQLIAERDDLIGKSRAKEMKPRTWEELFEDYRLDLLIAGVLPLGLLSLFLVSFVFGKWAPARNRFSLTDFEGRCVLFLPFAIVFSAFGFFLFVWILALVY